MARGRTRLATPLLFARCSAFFGNFRAVTSARCQRRGDSPKFERPSQRGKQNGGTRRCYARWETSSFASCGGFKSCLGATRAGQKWAEDCAHQATKRGEFGLRLSLQKCLLLSSSLGDESWVAGQVSPLRKRECAFSASVVFKPPTASLRYLEDACLPLRLEICWFFARPLCFWGEKGGRWVVCVWS